MKVDTDAITKTVVKAIADIQRLSGRDATIEGLTLKPVGDIDGFDSYCSIEATVQISLELGIEFDLESIFISQDWRRALTIEEVVARIRDIVHKDGEANE